MIRLIVHAGFHKTATTSLQQLLAANRDRLGRARVFLRPDMLALCQSARAWSVRRDPLELALFKGAAAEFLAASELDRRDVLILSSEDLSGHMPGRHGLTGYDAAPTLAEALVEAARAALGKKAAIAFYYSLRDPEAWSDSLQAHLAHRYGLNDTPAAFRQRLGAGIDLAAAAEAVARRVAPVPVHRARLEELAGKRLGPLVPLLDLLGLDDKARARLTDLPPANRKPAAVRLARP